MKSEILENVKKLRLALGDTQQQFAARLGLAISTVVRYELTRPPKGRALRTFENLAMENGQLELAEVFRNALAEELGVSNSKVSTELDIDLDALSWMRWHPEKYKKELRQWEKLRGVVKKDPSRARIASDTVTALGLAKLAKEGKTKKQAQDILGVKIAGEFGGRFPKKS